MSAPSHGVLQSVAGASSEVVGREAPQSCNHVNRVRASRNGSLTALSVILRGGKTEAPGLAFGYAELVGHVRIGDGGAGQGPTGDFSDSIPSARCFHWHTMNAVAP